MSDQKRVRVVEANRSQYRLVPTDLDALVAADDRVRTLWEFVEGLDLSGFYEAIEAVEGEPGRPAIDPKILLALWLQATLDGVGSARELARLCETHVRYQWICGGVTPGYHLLSDFRSNSANELDGLLTETVAILLHKGLAKLERVAQDGMKVRASAGASSFRSRARLRELRKLAGEQVKILGQEVDKDPGSSTRRQEAARRRAAAERERRVKQALKELEEVKERKKSKNGKRKGEPRSSTTDPQARVMKMSDGGFRPALNVHLVSDTVSKVIVAAEVNNEGTDQRMMVPLAEQIERRYDEAPAEWLADGGCVSLDGVNQLAERGTEVYAPIRAPRCPGRERTQIRSTDTPAVAEWRTRMSTENGKAIYRQRGATAELVNAHVRRRGLGQFLVRGLDKARSVLLLHVIAHNMRREWALR